MTKPVKLFPFGDDASNAERLAYYHGDEVRYCAAWGKWLLWDGGRWVVDRTEAHTQRALALADKVRAERPLLMQRMMDAGDDRETAAKESGKLVERQYRKIRSDSGCRALLRLARSKAPIGVTPDELDGNPWLLNVTNGTIDLRTGQLGEADPADLLTKQAPVQYHAEADCPQWRAFVAWATCNDQDLAGYLQRLAGYALTGCVTEQCLPVFYGSGGNGKGVWMETLMHLLGDYARAGAPFLLEDRGKSDHPTEVADLFGARMVVLSENERDRPLREGLVKQLTGGDTLKARFMRQDFFSFEPTHTILMAVNHQPIIRGTDEGIWRRIHLVPWRASLRPEERDPGLRDKLLQEGPGILRWAVEGCLEWQRGGLRPPETVCAATQDYRQDMDLIGQFLDDCCLLQPDTAVAKGDLYQAYQDWCKDAGHHAMSATKLGRDLKKRGFDSDRTSSVRVWVGMRLRPRLVDAPAERVPYGS